MARVFTHREFKLLLKPEKFRTKKSVLEFNDVLAKIARENGVRYHEFETMDSQIRVVKFFDTEDRDLRRNHIILRQRQDQFCGWPGEMYEITLKCRSSEYQEAADFDVSIAKPVRERRKFKEEILRGAELGTLRRIFSNNNVDQSSESNFNVPIARLTEIFPGLRSLSLDPSKLAVGVNSPVFEIQAKLGTLAFGNDVVAETGLAVWTRPTTDGFHAFVAEFGYSYHIMGSKTKQGHEAADEFFKRLQKPLKDWLFEGSTKTALIYDDKE